MIGDFSLVRGAIEGRDVIVLGNGPTVRMWSGTVPDGGAIATVNAGLTLLAELGGRADLVWVQDERFLPRRARTLLPHLSRAGQLVLNERLLPQLPPAAARAAVGLRMLGNEGFSRDPQMGVFHGYNAVFGLLQVLAGAGAGARRIDLFGVPLLYWSTDTRFDQAKRGADVDLHRASDQVALLTWAIGLVRESGIAVTVHGGSALTRATLRDGGEGPTAPDASRRASAYRADATVSA
ncbi:MAG: hypothetical protein LBJ08_03735 [Bifidobacteriaceae bacterium]|jgi:hypothetical protein|nr:hypothetical protein [Bifidobacteriaceae bacterium]